MTKMTTQKILILLFATLVMSCSEVEFIPPSAIGSLGSGGGTITPAQKLEWDLRQQNAGTFLTQDAVFNSGAWGLASNAVAESGSVLIAGTIDQGVVQQVQMRQSYSAPVVVAYVSSRNSDRSVDVRVQNVQPGSFEIFLERSSPNAAAADEEVHYLVVERGRHELNGLVIHAGVHTTTAFHRGPRAFIGEEVLFSRVFTGTPAVLTTLNTYNNADFLSSSVNIVTNGSFYVMQETSETNAVLAASEDIGWVAIEAQDYSWSGGRVTSGVIGGSNMTGIDDGTPTTISYAGFGDIPNLIVSKQTTNGNNGGWARAANSHDLTQAQVVTEEDRVGDNERSHIGEEFGWVALSRDLNISRYRGTGTIVSEPIDLSNLKYFVFADLLEPGTSDVVVSSRTSTDGGATWSGWMQIQNNIINGIVRGDSLDGVTLQLRITLVSSFFATTPLLSDLKLEIQGSNTPQ